MTPSPDEIWDTGQNLRPDHALACRQCGRPEAHAVGDELLCPACLHERGSCSAGRDEED